MGSQEKGGGGGGEPSLSDGHRLRKSENQKKRKTKFTHL